MPYTTTTKSNKLKITQLFTLCFYVSISYCQINLKTSNKFTWSTSENSTTNFNWEDGKLSKKITNINASKIDINFTVLGETNSLSKWPYSKTTKNSPAIGKDATNKESLQFYTKGFSSNEDIRINSTFSKPVEHVSFNLMHINKSQDSGGKFTLTATTVSGEKISPSFTNSYYPSYKSNQNNGVIDAIRPYLGNKALVNVQFFSLKKIKSINIKWNNCSTCKPNKGNGFAISGFTFIETTNEIDSDNDGIYDSVDIDDDNDGILDKIESSYKTIKKSTAIGSPLFTKNKGVRFANYVTDGINGKGAEFNTKNDELIVNLGKEIPANTYINFRTYGKYNSKKTLLLEQSNADGSLTSNPKYISHYFGYYPRNTYYKLNKNTKYIKIKMIKNNGGSIILDYLEHQSFSILTDIDTDNDGIPNRLDLDSDNDGCSDAVESCVPDIFIATSSEKKSTFLENAIIQGSFGANGFSNNLENTDYRNTQANFRDAYHYATNKDINACGTPMITQVIKSNKDNWIEITNIHPTAIIPKNSITIGLFKGENDDFTRVTPNEASKNPSEIKPGESLVFKNNNNAISLLKGIPFVNNFITNLSGSNNTITISRAGGKLTWESRIDVSKNIENNTTYVRIDEITAPNKNHSDNEWVAFIDDNLNPYRDLAEGGPERHPHSPLFSEIIKANKNANILLGLHRINPTERVNGVWTNGYPDRSRFVVVKEDYEHDSISLTARKLKVKNNSKLLINNNLLLVSDSITLVDRGDQIRLANTSELIQVHQNKKQFYGLGKILIDKKTEVASIYRYSYLSSPVNTLDHENFTISNVLKDGTNPISLNSEITDINFVTGFDGDTTSPISIADYWIYTFSSNNGSRANYEQKRSTGIINQTNGFLIKGTGVEQNFTFFGSAKDGELTTTIGAGDSYLLGNPYPSTISAKKFIEDNINAINGTLYFWQHAGEEDIASSNTAGHSFNGYIGGYATRNIAMGISANLVPSNERNRLNSSNINVETYQSPGNYIPVGVGFFVGGSETGGKIVFNNSQREYKTNSIIDAERDTNLLEKVLDIFPIIDFKDPNELPILKLGMDYTEPKKQTIHRQIGISFNKNNSFANENGYDSELFDLNDTDIYWKFNDDELKYSIAGVQEISSNLEVPLEIVLNYNGEISIGIDEKNHIKSSIYLKDKVTDSIYDLSKNVQLNLDSGTYTNRFYLTFSKGKNILDVIPEIITAPKEYLKIYFDNSSNKIIIEKEDNISISSIQFSRFFGRSANKWIIKNQRKKIQLKVRKRIRRGIYIVNIKTNKGNFNKKIIIE
ncbi:hypothetical protein [uncultured Polaribacter sp.]|uniref:hypothetical protein n=1 Tax=uncultured Polaribacter sp. TaxID=174711 RepID=UPI0026301E6D|nr:hypothetical protein [uncultured Polaribacter sp.]